MWKIEYDNIQKKDNKHIDDNQNKDRNQLYPLKLISLGEPDQYELRDESKNETYHTCVRSFQISRWLSTLENNSIVICRKVAGFDGFEPIADISVLESKDDN